MRHPSETQLALFAGDDLGAVTRWRLNRHLSRCGPCAREIRSLQAGREQVRDLASHLPDGVNWTRLTQEMTGNIRVGLAAGECISGFERSPRTAQSSPHKSGLAWNAAMVLACATVIAVTALWIRLPAPELNHLVSSLQKIRIDRIGRVVRGDWTPPAGQGVVLEASPFSIGIRENGGAMSLLQPRSQGVAVSVSMQGSAGARYVDADSGQVTTNRVYYAQ